MKLDFTSALNMPNKKFDFTFEWELNEDMFSSVPHKPLANGEVTVVYFAESDGVINLEIEVRIPFEFNCDKCGVAFKKNLYLVGNEKVLPDVSDDHFSYDLNNEVEIDLITNQVILALFPHKVLCKPNCKGLCQTCGKNLNHETCDCNNNKIGKNNPFGQLLGKIQ